MRQDLYSKCKHKTNGEKCPIEIVPSRNSLITQEGVDTLKHLCGCSNAQEIFAQIANTFGDNCEMVQLIYDYISKGWIYPTTHVVRYAMGLVLDPIACFLFKFIELDQEEFKKKYNQEPTKLDYLLNEIEQTKTIILAATNEGGVSIDLSQRRPHMADDQNGGITQLITAIRAMQEYATPHHCKKRITPIVFYLRVDHADILEFLELQQFKSDMYAADIFSKLQFGVIITDEFMNALHNKQEIELKDIKNNTVYKKISAAKIWVRILSLRHEKGNPFIFFIDNAIRGLSPALRKHVSDHGGPITNICTEIIQITGRDAENDIVQGVCCIVSVNLEKYDEWVHEENFITVVALFLDNILEKFVQRVKNSSLELQKATSGFINGIKKSRPIAIGSFGWHGLLMKRNIPYESAEAKQLNESLYSFLLKKVKEASVSIGKIRGAAEYNIKTGLLHDRFTTLVTCPPSTRAHGMFNSTPGVNLRPYNIYVIKGAGGSHIRRNKYLDQCIKTLTPHPEAYIKVWNMVAQHDGSIQRLSEIFSPQQQAVYKTGYEVDQLEHISQFKDRQKYIDQAQSLNLYIDDKDTKEGKKLFHQMHMLAYLSGLKTMYYTFSQAEIDTTSNVIELITSDSVEDSTCESCE